MLWASDGRSWIGQSHLADDKPVEQHAHGCELLLHGRRRGIRLQLLYIGGDVVRPDCCEREPALLAPRKESSARPGIGPARVRVADIRCEELDVAPTGLVAE